MIEAKGMLPDPFYEAGIALTPKPDNDIVGKKK